MCGFGGFYNFGHEKLVENPQEALLHIASVLQPRGPDAHGIYYDNNIGIAHTRLSIIDTSESANQPMKCRRSGVVIAFNGECYNFTDLKRKLICNGVDFMSKSDTEVVLMQYVKYGIEGLKLLEGIFSFCIWDPRNHLVLLMRDRLGVKPLYYLKNDRGLYFGSEIKAIRASYKQKLNINLQALSEYMWFGNTYEDRTIYDQIKTLPPGHLYKIDGGIETLEQWWDITDPYNSGFNYTESVSTILQNKIDESVLRQLVSDAPLGAFLSSGIDSKTIVSSAYHAGCKNIATYTARFNRSSSGDESISANMFAQELSVNNTVFDIEDFDLVSVVKRLAIAHDEPFADAANVPLYLMSKTIKDRYGIKVVLQGDGGDELFAGYRRYTLLQHAGIAQMVPRNILENYKAFSRINRILDALNQPDDSLKMALLLTTDEIKSNTTNFFHTDYKNYIDNSTDPFIAYKNANNRFKGFDLVNRMLLTDMVTQLPNQYLAKVDRATMAAGVESRVPLLDEKVVAYSLPMPINFKLKRGVGKCILKSLLSDRVGRQSISNKKLGFGVPFTRWLTRELNSFSKELITDRKFTEKFNLNSTKIENALFNLKPQDHANGYMLWKIFQLALWNETNYEI